MGMDGFADGDGIATYFDREADLADQVSGTGTDDTAAEHAMVGLVEQELGETLVAAIGDGAAGSSPGKNRLAVLDSLRLALVLGETRPCDFRVGIGNRRDLARFENTVLAGRGFRRNVGFVHR